MIFQLKQSAKTALTIGTMNMSDRRRFMHSLAGVLGLGFVASKVNAEPTLSPRDIARAWRDPAYRKTLSQAQWDSLPTNPAGELRSGEFGGTFQLASGNNCSGNNCSGNGCSGNNCSGNGCSGNNCSGNNCSGNGCSGNNCSGNNCSGNSCSGNNC